MPEGCDGTPPSGADVLRERVSGGSVFWALVVQMGALELQRWLRSGNFACTLWLPKIFLPNLRSIPPFCAQFTG